MTNSAWALGWKRLKACLRDRDLTVELEAERGQAYRKRLQHLDDDSWINVCDQAISTLEWFPALAQLLEMSSPRRPLFGAIGYYPERELSQAEKDFDAQMLEEFEKRSASR